MPHYRYYGIDRNGERCFGELEAENDEKVQSILTEKQVDIITLDIVPAVTSPKLWRRLWHLWIRSEELSVTFRRLAAFLRSAVPLVEALDTLVSTSVNPRLIKALRQIRNGVQVGMPLSDAIEESDPAFRRTVPVVRAAEVSGELPAAAAHLSDYYRKVAGLKKKLISASFYPLVTCVLTVVVLTFLLVVVFPVLTAELDRSNYPVPLLTQVVLVAGDVMAAWGLPFLLLAGMVSFVIYYLREHGRGEQIDLILLRIPILGFFLRQSSLNSWSMGMNMMLRSNVSLQESLTLVSGYISNKYLQKKTLGYREHLLQGSSLSEAVALDNEGFGVMASKIIQIGERTGELDDVFTELYELSEEELNNSIGWISRMAEPLLIGILGGIIGVVYFAFFLAYFAVLQANM